MAISKIGGTGSDNWELISSVTPTSGAAAVNFTGLTSYKKLLVVANAVTLNASNDLDLRINNDSGNNYLFRYWTSAEVVAQIGFANKVVFTFATASAISGMIEIENCDNTGIKKIVDGFGGANGSSQQDSQFIENGIYLASAIVTQINVLTDSTYAGAGTLSLYGVK